MTTSGMAPRRDTVEETVPAVAQGSTAGSPIDTASQAGNIAGVTYAPSATLTGADTNSRTVSLINRGQAGAGSTVVATLAFTAGVNGAAYDEKVIPVTDANKAVAEGDVLEWRSAHVGTGLADPGGLVRVLLDRD